MKTLRTARLTIGTLHRVCDTKPVMVEPAEMIARDAEALRSIDRIMGNRQAEGAAL